VRWMIGLADITRLVVGCHDTHGTGAQSALDGVASDNRQTLLIPFGRRRVVRRRHAHPGVQTPREVEHRAG